MNKIIDFQIDNKLVADGIIGKNTLFKIKDKLGIKNNEHLAMFVGQCAHESGNFAFDTENLNYSADRLLVVFKKYFRSNASALSCARNPEKIANKVYANRMGNGDELSGDGYKYRGRGAIQLTGKANYVLFSQYIKDEEIIDNPDLVADRYYFESAKFFFDKNKIWLLCDKIDLDSILAVTRKVNGGTNGLEDRIKQVNKFYSLLK